MKKGGGSNGTCGAIAEGADPDNECPNQGDASCGTTGTCNGARACALYPDGTTCAPLTCNGSIITTARYCDGNGTCKQAQTVDCSPSLCDQNGCQ